MGESGLLLYSHHSLFLGSSISEASRDKWIPFEVTKDVTLMTSDRPGEGIKAHKIILSIFSTFFSKSIVNDSNKSLDVIFVGEQVSHSHLKILVQMMYEGFVDLSQVEKLDELVMSAIKLGIDIKRLNGMTKNILDFLSEDLKTTNQSVGMIKVRDLGILKAQDNEEIEVIDEDKIYEEDDDDFEDAKLEGDGLKNERPEVVLNVEDFKDEMQDGDITTEDDEFSSFIEEEEEILLHKKNTFEQEKDSNPALTQNRSITVVRVPKEEELKGDGLKNERSEKVLNVEDFKDEMQDDHIISEDEEFLSLNKEKYILLHKKNSFEQEKDSNPALTQNRSITVVRVPKEGELAFKSNYDLSSKQNKMSPPLSENAVKSEGLAESDAKIATGKTSHTVMKRDTFKSEPKLEKSREDADDKSLSKLEVPDVKNTLKQGNSLECSTLKDEQLETEVEEKAPNTISKASLKKSKKSKSKLKLGKGKNKKKAKKKQKKNCVKKKQKWAKEKKYLSNVNPDLSSSKFKDAPLDVSHILPREDLEFAQKVVNSLMTGQHSSNFILSDPLDLSNEGKNTKSCLEDVMVKSKQKIIKDPSKTMALINDISLNRKPNDTPKVQRNKSANNLLRKNVPNLNKTSSSGLPKVFARKLPNLKRKTDDSLNVENISKSLKETVYPPVEKKLRTLDENVRTPNGMEKHSEIEIVNEPIEKKLNVEYNSVSLEATGDQPVKKKLKNILENFETPNEVEKHSEIEIVNESIEKKLLVKNTSVSLKATGDKPVKKKLKTLAENVGTPNTMEKHSKIKIVNKPIEKKFVENKSVSLKATEDQPIGKKLKTSAEKVQTPNEMEKHSEIEIVNEPIEKKLVVEESSDETIKKQEVSSDGMFKVGPTEITVFKFVPRKPLSHPYSTQTSYTSEISGGKNNKKKVSITYTCELCTFSTVRSECILNQHVVKVHHSGFRCKTCRRLFADKAGRKSHVDAAHPFHCDICDTGFDTVGVYNNHIQDYHSPQQVHKESDYVAAASATSNVKCDICDKHFSTNPARKLHMQIVHKVKDFEQQQPPPTNSTEAEELKCEEKKDLNNRREYDMCHLCAHIFRSESEKGWHVCPSATTCRTCDKSFQSHSQLKVHLHLGHKRGSCCFICGEKFNSYAEIGQHSQFHSRHRKRGISCQICRKVLQTERDEYHHFFYAHFGNCQSY